MGKYLLAIAMVCTLTNATAAFAECTNGSIAGWVLLNTPNPDNPNDICFVPLQAGMNTVTVRIWAIPFQKVRFSIPDPPNGTVVSENWFFPHTGDWANGVELDLGACSTAEIVTVGEIQVDLESDFANCYQTWEANSGEVQNCSGRWLPAGGYWHTVGPLFNQCCGGWQLLYSLQAHSLHPADGATNVRIDPILSWSGGGYSPCYVRIFTEPTCTTGQVYEANCDLRGFAPDFLLPNTTYYWRVGFPGDPNWGGGSVTAVHSFTTRDINLATEQTTWGRVKAMYRD